MKVEHQAFRAARALLGLEQKDIQNAIGITRAQLSGFENDKVGLGTKNYTKLLDFYESRGLRFTQNGGVEYSENVVRNFTGQSGFRAFMDEVYDFTKETGGEIEILNGRPDLFIKWLGREWYDRHAARMTEISHKISLRILTDEYQNDLIAQNFATYRRMPAAQFNDQTVYVYGCHVAVFTFSNDDLQISVFSGEGLSQTLKLAFNYFWEHAR